MADVLWQRRVDVCSVQETRWKGDAVDFVGAKGRRYRLWWKDDGGTGGVGVMVKELAEKVLEVRRNSVRVIVVVMVIGQLMVRVISGYALQENRRRKGSLIRYV